MTMRHWSYEVIAGLLLLILVIATMVNAANAKQRLADITACQTQLNTEYRALLDQRSNSAGALREAQLAYVDALAQAGTNESQAVKAALGRFRDAVRADIAARQGHPVPARTSCEITES